jgi:hypothetical protein
VNGTSLGPSISAMHDEPGPPQPPFIPRGLLWRAILIPPVATTVAVVVFSLVAGKGASEVLLLDLPIMAMIVLGFAAHFTGVMGKRYRGVSLVFLSCAYLLGQSIICLAIWAGACVLSMR